MRIIGEIVHPQMKVTIFKMNEKVSIKCEAHQIEHIIKFRDGSNIYNEDDVKNFMTSASLDAIYTQICETAKWRNSRFEEINASADVVFPHII